MVLHKAYVAALIDGKDVMSVREKLDVQIEDYKKSLDRQYQMALILERALKNSDSETEKETVLAFLNALRGGAEE